MWLVYAIALILGGGIVLLQMLAGGDHHIGHAEGALDAHHAPTGPGILSTRSALFAAFAFGLVGFTLHVLRLASPAAVLGLAALLGLVGSGSVADSSYVVVRDGAQRVLAATFSLSADLANWLAETPEEPSRPCTESLRG